ncbi:MAG: HAD-IA family hydrolase [Rhodospirillaceae bacterium]|nr:HAD-IA family hydrolase [Rhodospirillaceae bacterium]
MSGDELKLLVLDCDGTFVDSQTGIIEAMQSAFAENGVARPAPEKILHVVGLELLQSIGILAPTLGPAIHEKILTAYRQFATKRRNDGIWRDPLYPGAVEVMNGLSEAGWLMGVATGKSRAGLDRVLADYEISHHFCTLQTSDVAAGKPSPDMLERALAESGADASRAVMVGDTTYDMEMAVNANISAIGVAWGYHEVDALTSAGAKLVIERFDQLPAAAARLIGAAP